MSDTKPKAKNKKMKKERHNFEKKAIQESEPKAKNEINEDDVGFQCPKQLKHALGTSLGERGTKSV